MKLSYQKEWGIYFFDAYPNRVFMSISEPRVLIWVLLDQILSMVLKTLLTYTYFGLGSSLHKKPSSERSILPKRAKRD